MGSSFSLSFGKKTDNYIMRFDEIKRIEESFLDDGIPEQTYMITGIRGSGKTSLLTYIMKNFSLYDDWIVIDLNDEKDMLESLASELYENIKVKSLFVKKELSFSFNGITFKLEGETPIPSVETLIKRLLDRIKNKNKKVLITVDEVVNNEYMKIFVKTYQSLIRLDYPVFLLMTGLYDNINKLQDDKSLTFLYRAPKIYMNSLSLIQVSLFYKNILKISEEESIKLAKLTNGYAYAYQVLGYLVEKEENHKLTQTVLDNYKMYLSEMVYEKIYSELSKKEQEILNSFNTNEEIEIKTILKRINKDFSYFSVYRDRLIKKGIIESPTYGTIKFSLPLFNDFLKIKSNYF